MPDARPLPWPWLLRAHAARGLSPWWTGIATGGVLAAVLFAQEWLLGRLALAALPGDPQQIWTDIRVALTHVVVFVFAASAAVDASRTTDRTLERLRPLLDGEPAARDPRGERVVFRVVGLLSLAGAVLVNLDLSPGQTSLDPRTWTPETAWHRVLSFVIAWWMCRLGAVLVLESRRLSATAGRVRRVDLLDLAPLAPFARQGLRYALLVTGLVATYALFLVQLEYLGIFALVLGVTLPAAAVALLLPLRGVRERVRATKQAELAWCRARLHQRRRALEEGSPGPADAGRLDELVAWEARIEAVREWPLDAPVLARFALYLLLPLGSWAGGALVERLVDALLG